MVSNSTNINKKQSLLNSNHWILKRQWCHTMYMYDVGNLWTDFGQTQKCDKSKDFYKIFKYRFIFIMIYSNINENIKMKWWVIIVMSASSLLYINQLTRTGTLSLQVAFFNSVTSSQDKSMIWQEKPLHCKRKKLTISTFQKINKCLFILRSI
jgi:hypothetical protein